jgi:hypothetical protein
MLRLGDLGKTMTEIGQSRANIGTTLSMAWGMLMRPRATWSQIANSEDNDQTSHKLLITYILPLAAILPISAYFGEEFLMPSVFSVGWQLGLAKALINYVLAVVMVYLMAVFVRLFVGIMSTRPSFGACLKLAAYAATPIWLSGIFWLNPDLGKIMLAMGLYSLYLTYTGLGSLFGLSDSKSVSLVFVIFLIVMILAFVTESTKESLYASTAHGRLGEFTQSLMSPD